MGRIISIIFLDLVLSGDNAVVIAMATRKLTGKIRTRAIIIGTGGAVTFRVLLMLIAIQLLAIPFVKIIGGILLFIIAFNLVKKSQPEDEAEQIKGGSTLLSAVGTIIAADFVMSLDNILAIAGAADGQPLLAVFGLAISIPIVVFASQLIAIIMNRFPIIVWVGGLLIAYTAGTMIAGDALIKSLLGVSVAATLLVPLIFCALLLIITLFYNHIQFTTKRH